MSEDARSQSFLWIAHEESDSVCDRSGADEYEGEVLPCGVVEGYARMPVGKDLSCVDEVSLLLAGGKAGREAVRARCEACLSRGA